MLLQQTDLEDLVNALDDTPSTIMLVDNDDVTVANAKGFVGGESRGDLDNMHRLHEWVGALFDWD